MAQHDKVRCGLARRPIIINLHDNIFCAEIVNISSHVKIAIKGFNKCDRPSLRRENAFARPLREKNVPCMTRRFQFCATFLRLFFVEPTSYSALKFIHNNLPTFIHPMDASRSRYCFGKLGSNHIHSMEICFLSSQIYLCST